MLLPAETKLGQGNVFTGVCDSITGEGGSLPQCMLGYTPPGADIPSQEADSSIRSTSGRYWNAFLFEKCYHKITYADEKMGSELVDKIIYYSSSLPSCN